MSSQQDMEGSTVVRLTHGVRTRPRTVATAVTLMVIVVAITTLYSSSYQSALSRKATLLDTSAYFRKIFLVDPPKPSADTASLADQIKGSLKVREECIGVHNMTVVTAFFNIGQFPKGSYANMRASSAYVNWLRGFSSLLNPVMFFTDDPNVQALYEGWRNTSRDPRLCTVTLLVQREQFWPWRSVRNISEALKSKPYTNSPPCTTNPDYDAATNCKYPVTETAVQLNPFGTKHFAWLDAGIYRNSLSEQELNSFYVLDPLPNLPADRVGYLEIHNKPKATVESFILHHIDWIAGGMFFGQTEAMLALTREYSEYAQTFMRRQLVGADQQILGAMYGGTDNVAVGVNYPVTQLQLYQPNPSASADPWFHLAYLTRRKVL